ncbi:hypothetical protein RclHR1_01040039 [Rhizophagus clarus]|uniref:Uncharacterized protein n=1 Tax=Rhizophagus clarus TaxID=94130 RepID=A0A2Z6QFT0_9GLOM|nr:hypothetical protein RclHR1_01040039 [Rhizophagus clarus]GET02681.1 hypothetical protein GLOIN_2v1489205 [Rhizophagus clarus]
MINNNPEILAKLYGLFLYKKKDIIAIQKKLSIDEILERHGNANKLVVPPDSKLMEKTLADSYELLLELVGDLILVQENLSINSNPILEVKYQSNETSVTISLKEIFNLLMYLEDNIIAIQNELGIIGYSNGERAEKVNENVRAQF